MAAFKRATKRQSRLRMAIVGPSGAGKTFTALAIAAGLGERVAVIDTERGSASKYSDEFAFDVMELESFDPRTYIAAIQDAEAAGYDVLVIDSLSHAWMGKGGALELVDNAAKRSQSGNSFTAWRDVTPLHNALVEAMLQTKVHLLVTMRAKSEYIIEEVRGKKVPRKIGMAPIQRDGVEYEFDVVGDISLEHDLMISKTRCRLLDGAVFSRPGADVATILRTWLSDGTPIEPERPAFAPPDDRARLLRDIERTDPQTGDNHTGRHNPTTVPAAPPRQLADAATTAAETRRSLTDDPLGNGAPPSVPTITTPQAKRLFALAHEAGWADDAVRFFLLAEYGVASSKEIRRADYDDICARIADPTMAVEMAERMAMSATDTTDAA